MPSTVVIGAGPAGSLAALLLARAGFVVDLIEQRTFPRDKVCGECLSAVGQDVLERAAVLDRCLSVAPTRLTRTLLHPANGPAIDVPLPRASMGISRRRMDEILLNAASEAGVRVRQPARCEKIQPGAKPSVLIHELRSDRHEAVTTDWVVVADGKGALLPANGKPTGDLGIKAHFQNVTGPADAIELFAGPGHYGGMSPIEDGRWNAAFSVPAALVKHHCGAIEKVFEFAIDCNPALRERMHGAARIGPWLASPLPRFAVSDRWLPKVIPIGNAAAALEPVGGEGMGLALRSAELAAEAIIRSEQTGGDESIRNLPAEYRKLWRLRRTVCRGIGMLFSQADLADAVAPLISSNIGIPAALMRWAGKSQV